MVIINAHKFSVMSINLVNPSHTITIPKGGGQPPTLWTTTALFKPRSRKEKTRRIALTIFANQSGSHLKNLPPKEIRNAPAKGMTTNRGRICG